jgi:hypothetical protein
MKHLTAWPTSHCNQSIASVSAIVDPASYCNQSIASVSAIVDSPFPLANAH